MKLGEILKARREKLGFTIEEVSKHISVDIPHLKQIESCTTVPGQFLLKNLVKAYGMEEGDELENIRRLEYLDSEKRRSRFKDNLGFVKPMTKQETCACEEHKCDSDPLLAKGYHRICVTVNPVVWDAFKALKKDLYAFSGIEPTDRSLIATTILSVYEFKKAGPDKFTYKMVDLGPDAGEKK